MFGLLVNITIYDATTIHTYMHLFVFASERKKEASHSQKETQCEPTKHSNTCTLIYLYVCIRNAMD